MPPFSTRCGAVHAHAPPGGVTRRGRPAPLSMCLARGLSARTPPTPLSSLGAPRCPLLHLSSHPPVASATHLLAPPPRAAGRRQREECQLLLLLGDPAALQEDARRIGDQTGGDGRAAGQGALVCEEPGVAAPDVRSTSQRERRLPRLRMGRHPCRRLGPVRCDATETLLMGSTNCVWVR